MIVLRKTTSAIESCLYEPRVLFTNNVSVSRRASYFSANTAKKLMCSLQSGMGLSENKSILLSAPVYPLIPNASHDYHSTIPTNTSSSHTITQSSLY